MNTPKTEQTIMEKVKNASWAIVLFMAFIVMYQSCSTSKKLASMKAKLDNSLDSLATKKELSKEIRLEGLRTSKRMLYDNNAIIRTTVRPDDRMNQYDEEIKKIESEK